MNPPTVRTLFLAWRAPNTGSWYPVGRLTLHNGSYEFNYTRGAEKAARDSAFRPLPSFPHLESVYESSDLFPLFRNRAPSAGREDYSDFVQWVNLPLSPHDPLAVLARTGGRRSTDSFEVFPCPEPEPDGSYRVHFFVHGIAHLGPGHVERINHLQPGERLLLMWDMQNSHDECAQALRTNDSLFPGDRLIVGFCPRYLAQDVLSVQFDCRGQGSNVEVSVVHLNLPPAPLEFRLLCCLRACWPSSFSPCSNELYQPLVQIAHVPNLNQQ